MLEPYNEGDQWLFYAFEAIVVASLGLTCSLEMDDPDGSGLSSVRITSSS